jgi:hypothetical protein
MDRLNMKTYMMYFLTRFVWYHISTCPDTNRCHREVCTDACVRCTVRIGRMAAYEHVVDSSCCWNVVRCLPPHITDLPAPAVPLSFAQILQDMHWSSGITYYDTRAYAVERFSHIPWYQTQVDHQQSLMRLWEASRSMAAKSVWGTFAQHREKNISTYCACTRADMCMRKHMSCGVSNVTVVQYSWCILTILHVDISVGTALAYPRGYHGVPCTYRQMRIKACSTTGTYEV